MKKIAIVTKHMKMGGIPKVLISMLEQIKDDYEIDLYLMDEEGDLLYKIPKKVNIKNLYVEKRVIDRLKKIYKTQGVVKTLEILFYYIIMKYLKINNEKILVKIIPKIDKEYDILISYSFLYSVAVQCALEKINAKEKILWIHSQASIFKNTSYKEKVKKYQKYFSKFDKIFCVSKDVKNDFDKTYMNLSSKTRVFYNLVNIEEIKKLSLEKDIFFSKEINILTVGRLSKEKGQKRIIEVVEKLKKYKFVWYLIGDGEIKYELEELIKRKKLENKIKILGQILNPYPYIKASDIYVQPSLSEGYCTTILEAKILQKPIIATEFSGIYEQIKNNETGLVVENSVEGLVKGIEELLLNKQKMRIFSNNLVKEIEKEKNKIIEF